MSLKRLSELGLESLSRLHKQDRRRLIVLAERLEYLKEKKKAKEEKGLKFGYTQKEIEAIEWAVGCISDCYWPYPEYILKENLKKRVDV